MSEVFAAASSTEADWALAAAEVARALGRGEGAGRLGFLYLTDHHAAQAAAIRARLAAETGLESWIGCAAPGIVADGEEVFSRPGMAAMVAELPEGSWSIFDGAAQPAADWFGIVHADPSDPELPQALADLEEATGAFIVGGLTASAGKGLRFAGGLAARPLSGALMSDRVSITTGLTQGCNPFGPVHQVTSCERNLAITLDDQPALRVLESDLRQAHASDPGILERPLAVALPLMDADRPDYLVRDFTGIDRKRGVLGVGCVLRPGQPLQFCCRDAHSALIDLDRMLADIERRLEGARPRGALYVSCVARGPHLFGAGSQEVRRVQAALDGAPVVGFFAGGEISAARLYTYTGVLAVFT